MNQEELMKLAEKVGKNQASEEERIAFFKEITDLLGSLKQGITSAE